MDTNTPDDKWERLAAAGGASCRRAEVSGRPAFVMEPAVPAPGRPWTIYAPTFVGSYPTERHEWIFSRVLRAGIAITGMDLGESFGSPQGRAWLDAWHAHVTGELRFSPQAVLLPQSRGGLMLYTWASEHPEKVAGVTGIYTVCDLRSYPGLDKACAAYGMSAAELEASLALHNPVDRLAPLAARSVPIWHIHGDSDALVPLEPNAGALVRRYRALGGPAELLVVPAFGHIEHEVFFERQEIVDSICRQAMARGRS